MTALTGAKTRAEAVAEHLRRQIFEGRMSGGTRLRQNAVARELGVSTTPVREAFAVLVKEGLLTGDPHRGVTVSSFSIEDLIENYELRIALESLAAEKAAQNATAEDILDLEHLLDEMHGLPARDSARVEARYVALNARFHARIYAIAKRPRLFELIESLRDQAAIYIRIYTQVSSSPEASEAQHAAIVDAIRRHAPKRAAKAMQEHLDHNLQFLLSQVSESPHQRAA